jgi:hypothetical protein
MFFITSGSHSLNMHRLCAAGSYACIRIFGLIIDNLHGHEDGSWGREAGCKISNGNAVFWKGTARWAAKYEKGAENPTL